MEAARVNAGRDVGYRDVKETGGEDLSICSQFVWHARDTSLLRPEPTRWTFSIQSTARVKIFRRRMNETGNVIPFWMQESRKLQVHVLRHERKRWNHDFFTEGASYGFPGPSGKIVFSANSVLADDLGLLHEGSICLPTLHDDSFLTLGEIQMSDPHAPRSGPLTSHNPIVKHVDHFTWTDASGEHMIEATVVAVKQGYVKLKKQDGSTVVMQITKLSKSDQDVLHRRDSPQTSKYWRKMETQSTFRTHQVPTRWGMTGRCPLAPSNHRRCFDPGLSVSQIHRKDDR